MQRALLLEQLFDAGNRVLDFTFPGVLINRRRRALQPGKNRRLIGLGGAEELLTAANADPLFKLVCRHREIRSAGWLDYIGYTRDRKVAPGTGNINEIETNAGQIQQQIDALKPKDPPLLR